MSQWTQLICFSLTSLYLILNSKFCTDHHKLVLFINKVSSFRSKYPVGTHPVALILQGSTVFLASKHVRPKIPAVFRNNVAEPMESCTMIQQLTCWDAMLISPTIPTWYEVFMSQYVTGSKKRHTMTNNQLLQCLAMWHGHFTHPATPSWSPRPWEKKMWLKLVSWHRPGNERH